MLVKSQSGEAPGGTNLVERLQYWSAERPDEVAFLFLRDGEELEVAWTYSELDRRARGVAARLLQEQLVGRRVLLLFPAGLEFLAALLGCFYAGAIAVPVFPPRRSRHMARLQGIARDAAAAGALTITSVVPRLERLTGTATELSQMKWIVTDDPHAQRRYASPPDGNVLPPCDDAQIAMLQYTSGSTGSPKGVMLTGANLWHNCMVISQAFATTREDVAMSWLPAYHDMGLIGGLLTPLALGMRTILMSPMAFLQRPVRWLEVISRFGATISGGPNFAYDLCTKTIPDGELTGLDLSRWQVAYNGAEPIRAATLRAFQARMSPHGFQPQAFYPCYGMAEATLLVTGSARNQLPVIGSYHARQLDDGWAEAIDPVSAITPVSRIDLASGIDSSSPVAKELVSCGSPGRGTTVVIVHPQQRRVLPDNCVGEIWVHSASVGQGYLNHDTATGDAFRATLADYPGMHFLRTGDLGFVCENQLYVTGRIKDMIIVRGVNHYPQDIEMTVEQAHADVRHGCVAAFALERDGREHLAVVCEVERTSHPDWPAVIQAVRRRVSAAHEVAPEAVVLVRAGSIPKTSSGKIQRAACYRKLKDQSLHAVAQWYAWESGCAPEPDTQRAGADAMRTRPCVHTAHARDVLQPHPATLDAVYAAVREVGRDRCGILRPETQLHDLGLDSLERVQIASRLSRTFHGRLPEEVLVDCETCEEVAAAIDRQMQCLEHPSDSDAIPAAWYDVSQWPEYTQLQQTMAWLQAARLHNPYFQVHQGVAGATTRIGHREMINFCSYNYLGMSGDPVVTRAAQEAIQRYGTSVSASRLVSGERPLHGELEREIANFLGAEAALVFVGGHATNETTIGHLMAAGDLVLHDELAHNSILQGTMLSGAHRRPFPHNDWRALDRMLRTLRRNYRRVLIVLEGVYSMDGDFPDLPQFVELKHRHKTMLMVDEAHSIGTMGRSGRGICEHWGVPASEVDILMGTLSKALGSCGGYIAGGKPLVEYLKYSAPGFVYSVGLSPPNAAAALAALRQLQQEPERVTRCAQRSRTFLRQARQFGLNTGTSSNSPIVPVILGNSRQALRLARRLFERGVNVQPILYPAVEERSARLRFFLTAEHRDAQIRQALEVVADELRRIDALNVALPSSTVDLAADSPAQEGAA